MGQVFGLSKLRVLFPKPPSVSGPRGFAEEMPFLTVWPFDSQFNISVKYIHVKARRCEVWGQIAGQIETFNNQNKVWRNFEIW